MIYRECVFRAARGSFFTFTLTLYLCHLSIYIYIHMPLAFDTNMSGSCTTFLCHPSITAASIHIPAKCRQYLLINRNVFIYFLGKRRESNRKCVMWTFLKCVVGEWTGRDWVMLFSCFIIWVRKVTLELQIVWMKGGGAHPKYVYLLWDGLIRSQRPFLPNK